MDTDQVKKIRQCRIRCSVCGENFLNNQRLKWHLSKSHGEVIITEEKSFLNLEEFTKWKNCVEIETSSSYVSPRGIKILKGNKQRQYYICHRSYAFEPTIKVRKRALKSTGTVKIGSVCPSRMDVIINPDGKVEVIFVKNHVGHGIEIGKLRLHKMFRDEIAGKLQQGITMDRILDDIRDSADTPIRSSIIERQDLYNIARDYRIDYGAKRHEDDLTSVQLWVNEMMKLGAENSPVLYFKPPGQASDNDAVQESDFCLVVMTSFQKLMLEKFGGNIICVDGTHGTNGYKLILYTIMVVDELGKGVPCAYMFLNREDTAGFKLFFSIIKAKVGVVAAQTFMSDDAPALYNAWEAVMGIVENHLLCSWHVDRNWRSNLSKITGANEIERKVKKAWAYKRIRAVQRTPSTEKFETAMKTVLDELVNDPDTKAFGDYIATYYATRPGLWAYCYRLRLGINTNMFVEAHHKLLKYRYLNGKHVKRLDLCINALMKLTRDSCYKRLTALIKNKPSTRQNSVKASHTKSLTIPSNHIEVVDMDGERQWKVKSSSSAILSYGVIREQELCDASHLCLRCAICDICIHTFKCSCADSLIRYNICKHIHAVAQFELAAGIPCINNPDNDVSLRAEIVDKEVEQLQHISVKNIPADESCASNNFEEMVMQRVNIIIGNIRQNDTDDSEKQTIIKYLDRIVSASSTGRKNSRTANLCQDKININAKITKQLTFISKRKKRVKPPSNTESAYIVEGLVKRSKAILNIHSEDDHSYQANFDPL